MDLKIDQIAIYVNDRESTVQEIERVFGCNTWVKDEVKAKNYVNELFYYNLAFNYNFIDKNVEFEIIQGESGISYHNDLKAPCISHFGSHVEDLDEAVQHFLDLGYKILQENETLDHSGTPHRYAYTFIDTRDLLGYPLKLIRRKN